ncbi:hypothetical protein B0J11DRAFT_280208 [Dendryphion nanum]|uniref:DUF521 domain protein n=1 Tax=Dendryphion nanum TaxID=256645 RepID=A0A9P9IN99_9PLEO|nr:hypothetical protein B0J11DRAFT_280208 [Dendryphion nanum]
MALTNSPKARVLIPGTASGELLVSDVALSFMGGVDPKSGLIIDHQHPLRGRSLGSKILAIPSGRGSCSGSGVILELLLEGNAPRALIFQATEEILTLGVLVARLLFDKSIPILLLDQEAFSTLKDGNHASISETEIRLEQTRASIELSPGISSMAIETRIQLTEFESQLLSGTNGPAARIAMEAIVQFAELQGTTSLVPVSRVHIDACYYAGPSTLLFAQRLKALSAEFTVPTTLNALSVDRRRWRELGTNPDFGIAASELADIYVLMGAKSSFTCAPYLLDDIPKEGEQIGWAESNAVAFANSVLGAKTQKYPDFMDVFIAIVGRAPLAGCHLEEGRRPRVCIEIPHLGQVDDALYPILGHRIGTMAGQEIPFISGLGHLNPTVSDLKAFGAAFATTSSAPMFHIAGVTPEASKYSNLSQQLARIKITTSDLHDTWHNLNSATDSSVSLISLGNPHFSLEEFAKFKNLCQNRQKHPSVKVVITTGREIYSKIAQAGYIDSLESFGAEIITDTCWCMIAEPIIPVGTRNLMTNSAKYAHYAPGMVHRGVHFGSLVDCMEAACAGERKGKI